MFRQRRSTKDILILGASFHCKPPRFLTGLIHKVFYSSSSKSLLFLPTTPPPFLRPVPVKHLGSRLTVFAGHSENHLLDIYCYDVNIVPMGAGLTTCTSGCTFVSGAPVWLGSARHTAWHWCNCMEMVACSTSCYLFKCYGNITLLAISA